MENAKEGKKRRRLASGERLALIFEIFVIIKTSLS